MRFIGTDGVVPRPVAIAERLAQGEGAFVEGRPDRHSSGLYDSHADGGGRMKTRKVVSREYKLMLQAAKFAGPGEAPARRRRRSSGRSLSRAIASVRRPQLMAHSIRSASSGWSSFLDSRRPAPVRGRLRLSRPPHRSRAHRPEVTLKFRHPDRYVAEARQMKSRRIRATSQVRRGHQTRRSSRSTVSRPGTRRQRRTCRTRSTLFPRLFPDLPKRLGKFDGSLKLRAVNGFTARELVVTGAILTIGTKPKSRNRVRADRLVHQHQDTTQCSGRGRVQFSIWQYQWAV